MKEDILEQLVDEYLQHKGYFTQHNIKFNPRLDHPDFKSRDDSNHSDIDVLGFNPRLEGPDCVLAVSCKSWQAGFKPETKIEEIKHNKIVNGREAWKGFRELVVEKWAEAFRKEIRRCTGKSEFTYVTAVTFIKGSREAWENYSAFQEMIESPIKLLSFEDMLNELYPKLSKTIAPSSIGRILQLLKASGWLKTD